MSFWPPAFTAFVPPPAMDPSPEATVVTDAPAPMSLRSSLSLGPPSPPLPATSLCPVETFELPKIKDAKGYLTFKTYAIFSLST
jgi:hypothetical protein